MRIKSIKATDLKPVKFFEVSNLSDLIVIAGPNGVGKTRFVNSVLEHLRAPRAGNISIEIEATSPDEEEKWKKKSLTTAVTADAQLLIQSLQTTRTRRNFKSSIVYYESDRSIQKIKPLSFQFEYNDPWEEKVSWDMPSHGLATRWQDTQHAIFKKIQSQKTNIANRAIQLKNDGHESMRLEFQDPLEPFREAFAMLLGPKQLHSADVQNQVLRYSENGEVRDVATLSSGEREVLTITFDFLLRRPTDCIIFFDEPELHLHPELLGRLVTTLRSSGERNQFIFISHSPDIISASLNDSVVMLTPPSDDGANQAVMLGRTSETFEALQKLGQSVGIVALGKRIVFIEGTDSSLDKRTYAQILQGRFPDLVLQPSGGKDALLSMNKINDTLLSKTIWGIRFFMLADRDSAPAGSQSAANFRVLSKYHLENYFLDSTILANCLRGLDGKASANDVEAELREIATAQIGYAAALVASKEFRDQVGNIDIKPKGAHAMSADQLADAMASAAKAELERTGSALSSSRIESRVIELFARFKGSLEQDNDSWKTDLPGKPILAAFGGKHQLTDGRLKNLYFTHAPVSDADSPFREIVQIFQEFSASR